METTVNNIESYQKHFTDKGFWSKLGKMAKKAGSKLVYHALLLYYVLKDPNTPMRAKGIILGALGYFILPIDIIPDVIVVLGFTDDLAAIMAVMAVVGKYVTSEMKEKAKAKCQKWFPEEVLVY